MRNSDVRHIKAGIGTALFMLLVFLLLWFLTIGIHREPEPEDEGIEVAFGSSNEGGGSQSVQSEQMPAQASQSTPQQKAEPTEVKSEAKPEVKTSEEAKPAEKVLTQEEEDALAIIEQQRRDSMELALEEEQKKLLKQQKKQALKDSIRNAHNSQNQQQIESADNNARLIGSKFGTSTTDGGGETTGNSQRGNTTGHGNIGGASGSGRTHKTVNLVNPNTNFTGEGIVAVRVVTDAAGKVTHASPIVEGSTTLDSGLQKLALDAAKKVDVGASTIDTVYYKFVQKQ